ncbi:glucose-1-phosphate cytidylyltransferase [Fluviispira multicolorata]|uniref:Glucose-1-phosphate cytidylyltransferase n=1 Tax=Fluviispira multicolorata TaxID=2654512 RepID=A0A833JAM0_9BACT|nr:glucose-1-phosphate cytidylyltransferase [Fluviispira multicolorata]KAB8028041.1 glucose-1-phosphate cytidylyltransferase [Fluviispira multicolorata]
MKTVILAGGYGTRIRDVSSDIPKPMIPVGEFPILWHIMKHYSYYDIKDFILCLGYKSEVIKDYFLNHLKRQNDFTLNLKSQELCYHSSHIAEDWQIIFAETGLNSFTGARLFKIKKYLENDDYFMLTYGDGVGNVNIEELMCFHKNHGKLMTITGAHPPGRFGELEVHKDQVVGFNEKPQVTEGWISAGFFVCNKEVLDYLTPEENLVFEQGPIENIVKDGQLMCYKHPHFWHPMDTSRDYQLLNQLWDQNKAPWKIWS